MLLVAVDVPQAGDPRQKHWAKVVTGVDSSRASGWAFSGDFIADGGIQDVPPGAIILVYGEKGGRENPRSEAHVYTVNADATLTHHVTAKGRAWARTLRDRVADLLSNQAPNGPGGLPEMAPDLSVIPDEALTAELTRRGYRVNRTNT
jgi:hypothetical protein